MSDHVDWRHSLGTQQRSYFNTIISSLKIIYLAWRCNHIDNDIVQENGVTPAWPCVWYVFICNIVLCDTNLLLCLEILFTPVQPKLGQTFSYMRLSRWGNKSMHTWLIVSSTDENVANFQAASISSKLWNTQHGLSQVFPRASYASVICCPSRHVRAFSGSMPLQSNSEDLDTGCLLRLKTLIPWVHTNSHISINHIELLKYKRCLGKARLKRSRIRHNISSRKAPHLKYWCLLV